MVQALVPLKDLVQAKTRLAGLLSPSERRALAQAMVEDVLSVLVAHRSVSTVTLVSDDPGAHLLAAQYTVQCWPESEMGCSGLNAVIAAAVTRLRSHHRGPLLVLHGDLPLLGEQDLSAVLDSLRGGHELVIGTDRHGKGTNLLAFAADCLPDFRFGPGSCDRHLAWAADSGVSVEVLKRDGIALDVDEPDDLRVLLRALQGQSHGHTGQLLADRTLAARIELATASRDDSQLDGMAS